MLTFAHDPAVMFACLAAWEGACCAVANMMKHHRAYGASLCGLTTAVVVILSFGVDADPSAFAIARAIDTAIGVLSSGLVVWLFRLPTGRRELRADAQALMVEVVASLRRALTGAASSEASGEHALFTRIARLESSLEDSAAGSTVSRSRLKHARRLIASLLDVIAIARTIRALHLSDYRWHDDQITTVAARLQDLCDGLTRASVFKVDRVIGAVEQARQRQYVVGHPLLEMCRALSELEQVFAALGIDVQGGETQAPAPPRIDMADVRLAGLRGAFITLVAGAGWIAFDWGPMRFFALGACIFTILFSTADEPAVFVGRILVSGMVAALAAFTWRIGVIPHLSSGYWSVLLAAPLFLGAALIQVGRSTAFFGLAFNMLFAVFSQPPNMAATSPLALASAEAMLLLGILLSFCAYRWLLPMNAARRRGHIKANMAREIARLAAPGDDRARAVHFIRLKFLALALVVRASSNADDIEYAVASLCVGHAASGFAEALSEQKLSPAESEIIRSAQRAISQSSQGSQGSQGSQDSAADAASSLAVLADEVGTSALSAEPSTSAHRWQMLRLALQHAGVQVRALQ